MAAMTPGIDNDASFDAFYRRRWRDAARWATALCGDRALGEELAQEAFVRVEPRFAALDNADGYLRTTVVNLTKASHRSTARRRWRERTTAQRDVTPAGDPDGSLDPDLYAALSRLSHEQRTVLVLRYWADWDEPTIAESLGCERATVRSHAKRGLDRLRSELSSTTPQEDPR